MRLDLTEPVRGVPWGEPISVPATASVRHVASVLARLRVGAVLVQATDEGDVGVVAERDVVHAVAAGLDLDRTTAADVMTPELVTVDVLATVETVVQAMVQRGVRHVAIVDGDEIVGVLSARDVLGRLATGEERAALRSHL